MKFGVYKHQAQRTIAVIMHLPLAAYPFVLPPEIRRRLPCQTMATLQQAEPFTGPLWWSQAEKRQSRRERDRP